MQESVDGKSPLVIVDRKNSEMIPQGRSESPQIRNYKNPSILYARTKNLATQDEQEQFEYKFPFTNTVKTDKYSVNKQ